MDPASKNTYDIPLLERLKVPNYFLEAKNGKIWFFGYRGPKKGVPRGQKFEAPKKFFFWSIVVGFGQKNRFQHDFPTGLQLVTHYLEPWLKAELIHDSTQTSKIG